MAKKAWGGRFKKPTSKIAEQFSESVSFDKRLYEEDIKASIAHVRMLTRQKIIPRADAEKIILYLYKWQCMHFLEVINFTFSLFIL